MEVLRDKQKTIYDKHIIKLDTLKVNLDSFSFTYGIRLKERKLKRLLTSIKISSGVVVLDIGCRDGRFLNKLNTQYKTKGVGIDISRVQLRENLENNPLNNIYYGADAEDLPFKDNSFDFVFCLDVLEHLSYPAKCISEISRVLKSKGKTLIYTINQKDKYTWHWFLRKVSKGRLGVDRGEFGDHNRDNFLRVENIVGDCQDSRLKIDKIILFHSFFTLAFDEIWPRFLHFVYKTMRKDSKSKFSPSTIRSKIRRPSMSIRMCSYLADFILSPLELIDRLWADKGYSNGFFMIAQKVD